jgi:uncharacterized membrane protein
MSTLGVAGTVVFLLFGVGGIIFFYFMTMNGFSERFYTVALVSGAFIAFAIIIGIEDRKKNNTENDGCSR